jgi:hypothetical protein
MFVRPIALANHVTRPATVLTMNVALMEVVLQSVRPVCTTTIARPGIFAVPANVCILVCV